MNARNILLLLALTLLSMVVGSAAEISADGLLDALDGDVFLQGDVQWRVGGIDADGVLEASVEQHVSVAHLASQQQGGHLGAFHDGEGQFSHERLAVGSSFPCDDEVGIADELVEMEQFHQQMGTWTALGVQILHESISQSTCRPSTWSIREVVSKQSGGGFCKMSGTFVELFHHSRRGSLLRCEDTGGSIVTAEGILNVGGYGESQMVGLLQNPLFSQHVNHPYACIAGGAPTQAHNELACSMFDGVDDDVANPTCGGNKRIALVGGELRKSTSLCYLDGCTMAVRGIKGSNGAFQRVVSLTFNGLPSQSFDKGREPPFTSIADGQFNDVGIGHERTYPFSGGVVGFG